jgi:pimeloyl-ACP methyl ester carboxylesterase
MDRFEHEGVEIAYEQRGAGPALLFLHNGGASSTIWRHQTADLSASYRTVAVDLPGFGCSPRPAAGVDLPGQVALLGALVDHLGLAPVLLVGNCMGSNIAARLAARRPDDVVGLVLVNPLTEATFSAGRLGPLHAMARRAPGPTRVGRRLTRRVVPPRLAARAALRFQVGPKGRALGLHHDPALVAANRRADQMPALVDVLDDMAAYGELDAGRPGGGPPVCTIWGAQNRVLSPRAGAALDERLAPERAERIEGCGHYPMLEDPEAVTGIIAAFAAAHAPAAPAAAGTPDVVAAPVAQADGGGR